ncbi:MAG: hypothetical protein IIA60_13295 [Candidatus Marinimicrobia bacterium]|nr:hypothetical protein [Candidatus Neomarinimicrobiota bacterium]
MPPRDPVALADAIGEMFNNGQLRRHCATAARRYVASDFNIRRSVRQLLEIF